MTDNHTHHSNQCCGRPAFQVGWLVLFGLFCMLLAGRQSAAATTHADVDHWQDDTLNIQFRLDSISIDMGFANNAARWEAFERKYRQRFGHARPGSLRIDIYAGASPEGPAEHNRWLGENRGQAVRRLIRQRLGRNLGNIVIFNEAARWDQFYDLVANSDEPWRDEVLRIIEMPASAEKNVRDHRELKLRELHSGTVWPVLLEKYLAPLRSGATAVISWLSGRDTVYVRETIVTHDTVLVVGPTRGRQQGTSTGSFGRTAVDVALQDSIEEERLAYPAWAVKTNMLLLAVAAPNIEVEIPLGRHNRWSLEAEYFIHWFVWNHNAQASQFHNLGLELRHYLGNRGNHRWLDGWHIGLATAVGYYDWEWKKHEGYQGEYVNAYLNLGLQRRWGRHWAINIGAGVGAVLTKYRHYYGGSVYPENHLEEWDKHLIGHREGNYQWYGPCHVNVSLAYMFNAWPFHTKSKKLDD